MISALLLAAALLPAAAAPLNAANYDRLKACGATADLRPLFYNPRLSEAARRLSQGASLERALADSGYIATRSTLLHLSGAGSDADIQRLLAAHYCPVLKDPALKDFGVERRGREVYLVLAAAANVPKAGGAAAVRREILALVNEARAQGRRCGGKAFAAAPAVVLDAALTRAALAHSNDMAQHDAFDHKGTDGSTPAQRVERAGYGEHRLVGENIAAGAMSAAEVMQGWLASPGHCENIMDARFTQIGIAYAENPRTASDLFWTQDFATPR